MSAWEIAGVVFSFSYGLVSFGVGYRIGRQHEARAWRRAMNQSAVEVIQAATARIREKLPELRQ